MKIDSDWIKDLNAGDEVAVDNSNHWHRNVFEICKVVKITPTGRIKLDNGAQFYPDGRKVGDKIKEPLRQITPEILSIIERRELIRKISFDSIKGMLSVEQLKTILEWQTKLGVIVK